MLHVSSYRTTIDNRQWTVRAQKGTTSPLFKGFLKVSSRRTARFVVLAGDYSARGGAGVVVGGVIHVKEEGTRRLEGMMSKAAGVLMDIEEGEGVKVRTEGVWGVRDRWPVGWPVG